MDAMADSGSEEEEEEEEEDSEEDSEEEDVPVGKKRSALPPPKTPEAAPKKVTLLVAPPARRLASYFVLFEKGPGLLGWCVHPCRRWHRRTRKKGSKFKPPLLFPIQPVQAPQVCLQHVDRSGRQGGCVSFNRYRLH
eukprot:1183075-Prorocentrum_minimum.AAC.1